MFPKILIANRSEIACRIIKTARRMGIESVAVYSSADRFSPHVTMADDAYFIGPPAASASYLNIDAIIKAAIASGAAAIHPGYGFLSENPAFARACELAGIVFIGPSVRALEIMGSKQLAKQLLETTDVPLTPGYHGSDQSDARLWKEAQTLGLPVLLKAANGGGGKGMRAVEVDADFASALDGARREAKAYFGDDTMLIEKLLKDPRHIEIQIMADNRGNTVTLFERDCSVQRRHQKIIEEAPAPNLPKSLREQLAAAALSVAKAIAYRGAGTVEFLVDKNDQFYFMEMNTRLQVEHGVTEMITGIDLVEWQLRIAAGDPLPASQKDIHAQGHALECRIYAEDPNRDFMPSVGQLHFLKEPVGEGLRIDSGVHAFSEISMHYDPMIAKLIAYGRDRTEALQRLQQALKQYHVGGVKTNIPFLQTILKHTAFVNAHLDTDFLSKYPIDLPSLDISTAVLFAAALDYLEAQPIEGNLLQRDTFSWQMHLPSHWYLRYLIEDMPHDVVIEPIDLHAMKLQWNQQTFTLHMAWEGETLIVDDGEQQHKALVESVQNKRIFYTAFGPVTVLPFTWQPADTHKNTKSELIAPMPSTVVAVLKKRGDTVSAGDRLMILEAMKMEHTIKAPSDGVICDVFYQIGEQVCEGAELVAIEPTTPTEVSLS